MSLLRDPLKVFSVLGGQVVAIDGLDEPLTVLKRCTQLVWQPSCDGSSTGSFWIFDIIDDVLLHHSPVLVSEACTQLLVGQQEVGRIVVLLTELPDVILLRKASELVDVCLMVVWPVISQLEEILGQLVLWVIKSKCTVSGRDDAVLGASLSSVVLGLVVKAALIDNSIWEDIIISCDSHNKGSEI